MRLFVLLLGLTAFATAAPVIKATKIRGGQVVEVDRDPKAANSNGINWWYGPHNETTTTVQPTTVNYDETTIEKAEDVPQSTTFNPCAAAAPTTEEPTTTTLDPCAAKFTTTEEPTTEEPTTEAPTEAPTTARSPPRNDNCGCPNGWIVYEGSCYWVEKQRLSMHEAEQNCQQKGATMMTANTLDEWDSVRYYIPSDYMTWTGLVKLGDCEQQLAEWQVEDGWDPRDFKWLINASDPQQQATANGWSTNAKCAAVLNTDVEAAHYFYFHPCDYDFYSVCELNATFVALKEKLDAGKYVTGGGAFSVATTAQPADATPATAAAEKLPTVAIELESTTFAPTTIAVTETPTTIAVTETPTTIAVTETPAPPAVPIKEPHVENTTGDTTVSGDPAPTPAITPRL